MNRADVALMNQSLQSAGDSFQRALATRMAAEEAAKRTAVEEAFRAEQLKRLDNQGERAGLHYDLMERKADAALENQQLSASAQQKQGLLKTIMGLNGTGQLSDEGRNQVNKWLMTDPDLNKIGLQLSAPVNPSKDPAHKQSALVQSVATIKEYRDLAAQAETPDEAAQFDHLADLIESNLDAAVKATTAAKPNEMVSIQRDAEGKEIGRTKEFVFPQSANAPKASEAPKPLDTNFQSVFNPDGGNDLSQYVKSVTKPAEAAPIKVPNGVQLMPTDLNSGASLAGDGMAAPATPPVAGQATGMVRVIHPNGQSGMIPRANLPAALQQGYKLATQ